MIRKLPMILLPVLALGGGIAAGAALQPAKTPPAAAETGEASDAGDPHADASGHEGGHAAGGHGSELVPRAFFTFPSQFFVPLARNGDMGAMMILTLALETDSASLEPLGRQEHRLRDALLRQLMIHANTGGFDGNYTVDRNLERLRSDLLQAARARTELPLHAVLIQDILRQGG